MIEVEGTGCDHIKFSGLCYENPLAKRVLSNRSLFHAINNGDESRGSEDEIKNLCRAGDGTNEWPLMASGNILQWMSLN